MRGDGTQIDDEQLRWSLPFRTLAFIWSRCLNESNTISLVTNTIFAPPYTPDW